MKISKNTKQAMADITRKTRAYFRDKPKKNVKDPEFKKIIIESLKELSEEEKNEIISAFQGKISSILNSKKFTEILKSKIDNINNDGQDDAADTTGTGSDTPADNNDDNQDSADVDIGTEEEWEDPQEGAEEADAGACTACVMCCLCTGGPQVLWAAGLALATIFAADIESGE